MVYYIYKERCSISVIDLNCLDTESMVLGDYQFLTDVIIRPRIQNYLHYIENFNLECRAHKIIIQL